MIKIAENFFNNQKAIIDKLEDFDQTDLSLYFEKLFGQMTYVEEPDDSKHFFISVRKTSEKIMLCERVFHKFTGGEPVGYMYPGCLDHLSGRTFKWDHSGKGYQLSRYGYLIHNLKKQDKEFIKHVETLQYDGGSSDKTKHKRFSSKYSNLDTTNKELKDAKDLLRRALPNSSFLQGMDYYQTNLLYYPKGTVIRPHNDVDVKSFANIVLSSASNGSKTTIIGELDWHRSTMDKLYFGGYDNKDIQDRNLLKKELLRYEPDGDSAIVFNFFNPRFYHEVPSTLEECYTSLVFGTYKSIMKEADIDW